MPYISLVIPVYNAELTLSSLYESIVANEPVGFFVIEDPFFHGITAAEQAEVGRTIFEFLGVSPPTA